MSRPHPTPWTIAEFFEWQLRQTERYEPVGGFPVRMMAGARNVHDDIVVNLIAELRNQLRGGPCRPFTGDSSLETLPGQIRRPDAGVDCGRRDPTGLMAVAPKMVAEVLSPTTRDFDAFEKLAGYQQVVGLEHILLIEPNAAEIVLWSRDDGRIWQRKTVRGLEQAAEMPSLQLKLALSEIYDGVVFPAGPRVITE